MFQLYYLRAKAFQVHKCTRNERGVSCLVSRPCSFVDSPASPVKVTVQRPVNTGAPGSYGLISSQGSNGSHESGCAAGYHIRLVWLVKLIPKF